MLEAIATLCAGLFSGAAIYVSAVEHPARLACGTKIAWTPGAGDPYAGCWKTPAVDRSGSRLEDRQACDARVEASLLKAAAGRAKREGSRLRLLPAAGAAVLLADDLTDTESHVRYLYRAYLGDIGYHLIGVFGYEGHGFLLVSMRTGGSTPLTGVPIVSPDRSRFVTASLDLEVGYIPNLLQVWRLTKTGPVREFEVNGALSWGPSDPTWRDDRTIEFQKHVATSDLGLPSVSRARLVSGPKGWTMAEQATPPHPP